MRSILAKLTVVATACVAVFLLLGTLLVHPAKVQAAVEAPHPGTVAMQLGRHTKDIGGYYCGPPSFDPQISMLLAKDKVWIGLTIFWPGDTHHDRESEQFRWTIPNIEGEYDWQTTGQTLAELHLHIEEYEEAMSGNTLHRHDASSEIEIAAEDEVQYGQLVAAMDLAVANEFRDFSVVDTRQLMHWFRE